MRPRAADGIEGLGRVRGGCADEDAACDGELASEAFGIERRALGIEEGVGDALEPEPVEEDGLSGRERADDEPTFHGGAPLVLRHDRHREAVDQEVLSVGTGAHQDEVPVLGERERT